MGNVWWALREEFLHLVFKAQVSSQPWLTPRRLFRAGLMTNGHPEQRSLSIQRWLLPEQDGVVSFLRRCTKDFYNTQLLAWIHQTVKPTFKMFSSYLRKANSWVLYICCHWEVNLEHSPCLWCHMFEAMGGIAWTSHCTLY